MVIQLKYDNFPPNASREMCKMIYRCQWKVLWYHLHGFIVPLSLGLLGWCFLRGKAINLEQLQWWGRKMFHDLINTLSLLNAISISRLIFYLLNNSLNALFMLIPTLQGYNKKWESHVQEEDRQRLMHINQFMHYVTWHPDCMLINQTGICHKQVACRCLVSVYSYSYRVRRNQWKKNWW